MIIYGEAPSIIAELEKEYDMIVDCTGFHRVYLPKNGTRFLFTNI